MFPLAILKLVLLVIMSIGSLSACADDEAQKCCTCLDREDKEATLPEDQIICVPPGKAELCVDSLNNGDQFVHWCSEAREETCRACADFRSQLEPAQTM